tara:strand:+ start:490 stop:789 length:300 start_codon:yes stop_codon:yes gene_type:complete
MSYNSKDAKKVKEFDISCHTKGFTSSFTVLDEKKNEILTYEYFKFKEIYQIVHYPSVGVEIINYNGDRRVFYNDSLGAAHILFTLINKAIVSWMNSNLN